MLKSHETFHSSNGKRLVLIVDDEFVNREMLGAVLSEEYEVLYAENGKEAMEKIRENQDVLSLVLLDLMMPVMSGKEVLREIKADAGIRHIPVIVLTADQDAEIESLSLGAADFIPKPYPQAGIILARILRTIELSEDREIIQSTERDPLTGLYNKEYFYRYAEQFDLHHKDLMMDAIVVDVNHFHMINERFGTAYGDEVLCRIGNRVREMVHDGGGIVCRREADTFMIYCPHREDYQNFLDNASVGLAGDESVNNRVRLRLGVYANADKTIEVERRFDRAKSAANTVRNSFTRTIGIYDETLHERELYAEQLIEEFHQAIEQKQFQVYYQPKFEVKKETPSLAGAEALVRWQHPVRGLINPGIFIPLFEENGLIQQLDYYVWEMAAEQAARWKETLSFTVPISVNVSRIDMYDPHMIDHLQKILRERELETKYLHLEITESAYTQDSEQIIETVNQLRSLGFSIEMDDFGTGYSSLNMISALPIDALKLDMQFVRGAFKERRDTRMLEVIIDIAGHLKVPVIAEGVENEEQLDALKGLGCDIVQGYYFSKPVPAQEFEAFLIQEREQIRHAAQEEDLALQQRDREESRKKEERIRREAAEKSAGEEGAEKKGMSLRHLSRLIMLAAVLAAAALFLLVFQINHGYQRSEEAIERYLLAQQASEDMEDSSDYLTDRVRCFAMTGELRFAQDFFREVDETRRRDNALEDLRELMQGEETDVTDYLAAALRYSNELIKREYYVIRLTQQACHYPDGKMSRAALEVTLSEEDQALSDREKRELARSMLFDDIYISYKDLIRGSVTQCTQDLIEDYGQKVEQTAASMNRLLVLQVVLTAILLLLVAGLVMVINRLVRKPVARMISSMQEHQAVPVTGARELRYVARTYNIVLEESQKTTRELTYEATHDALTGLYNRSAYDLFMSSIETDHIALLHIDVDEFKKINDTYGHDVGDKVLKRVAEILRGSFRSVDIICRTGGDEFVVIMTRANSSMSELVRNKIAHANRQLSSGEGGLPKASLSVGVAFSDRKKPDGDLFKDADTALYRVKRSGRCGCEVYE